MKNRLYLSFPIAEFSLTGLALLNLHVAVASELTREKEADPLITQEQEIEAKEKQADAPQPSQGADQKGGWRLWQWSYNPKESGFWPSVGVTAAAGGLLASAIGGIVYFSKRVWHLGESPSDQKTVEVAPDAPTYIEFAKSYDAEKAAWQDRFQTFCSTVSLQSEVFKQKVEGNFEFYSTDPFRLLSIKKDETISSETPHLEIESQHAWMEKLSKTDSDELSNLLEKWVEFCFFDKMSVIFKEEEEADLRESAWKDHVSIFAKAYETRVTQEQAAAMKELMDEIKIYRQLYGEVQTHFQHTPPISGSHLLVPGPESSDFSY